MSRSSKQRQASLRKVILDASGIHPKSVETPFHVVTYIDAYILKHVGYGIGAPAWGDTMMSASNNYFAYFKNLNL